MVKNSIYNNFRKDKRLLSLALTLALYNNLIISYYDISGFEHIV